MKKNSLYTDSKNLYGHLRSQSLPYDEIKYDKNVKLEEILNTTDDSDIGYFIEVGLNYSDDVKCKAKNFPFAPEDKKLNPDDFSEFMKTIKPNTYTQTKKLIRG